MPRHLWGLALLGLAASCTEAPALAPQLDDSGDGLARTLRLTETKVSVTSRYIGDSVVGDYNGDGYDDLADVGEVWLGKAGFATAPTTWTPTGSVSRVDVDSHVVHAGDFNGDGYDDYVAVDSSKTYIYLGSTSGLGASPAYTLTGVAHDYAVVDWNSDGYDDLWIVWKPFKDSVQRFMGSKTGLATTATETLTLGDSTKHTRGRHAFGVYAGDFDSDGKTDDIVVSGDYSWTTTGGHEDTSVWLLTWGSGAWTQRAIGTSYSETTSCYTENTRETIFGIGRGSSSWGGDNCMILHDSAIRAFACHGSPPSRTYVTQYGGPPPWRWSSSGTSYAGPHLGGLVLSGDLDDDGDVDYRSVNPAHVVSIINGSDGSATTRSSPEASYVGDFDGDGRDELLATGSGYVFVYTEVLAPPDDDKDGFPKSADCNDNDASIYPGAEETWYDGVDSDCAEDNDYDQDGDGFDSDEHGGTDCVDTDDRIYPGVEETWYDGIDSDCAGDSDYDQDDDGFDSGAYGGTDCDDADPQSYPLAPDAWYDGIDSDCAGDSDYDQDRDGFDGYAFGGQDCDDEASEVNPSAVEQVGDALDQNCDRREICFIDRDGDGYRGTAGGTVVSEDIDCTGLGEAGQQAPAGDCDDTNARTFPGAREQVGDEADQDCDGAEVCFADADGDGWRTEATVTSSDIDCTDVGEASAGILKGDCEDGDAEAYPGAVEIAGDGIDQDCDGLDAVPPKTNCQTAPGGGAFWALVALGLGGTRRPRPRAAATTPSQTVDKG